MGLINCPECGKEISDKAANCPNCGCPIGTVSTTVSTNNTYTSTGNSPYQNNNPYQAQQSSQQVHPYTSKQKNSGLGIAALILSILGCTFWLGIILAIVDLCKKDNNKKTCSIIALCVCGFWIIVGIAVNSGDKPSEETLSSRTTVESDQTSEATGESVDVKESDVETSEVTMVEETQSEDKSTSESEEKNEETSNIFYVGDVLETKRVKLSYLSCGEYKDENIFIEAGTGNKFVYFEFEFENIGDVDVSVGSFDFDCYADGYDAKSSMSTADNAMISITTLSPGRKTSGIVVFEVPQNAETIEVEYETSYWTQDKAIFLYE